MAIGDLYGKEVFNGSGDLLGVDVFDIDVIASDGFDSADADASITIEADGKTLQKASGSTAKSAASKTGNSTKRYAEFAVQVVGTGVYIGVAPNSVSKTGNFTDDANGFGYYSEDGQKYNNGIGAAYGDTYTTGDVINIALDVPKVWFGKNGTWQASGNPATGVNPAYSSLSGNYRVFVSFLATGTKGRFKSVDGEFITTKPSGYTAWEDPGGGGGDEGGGGGGAGGFRTLAFETMTFSNPAFRTIEFTSSGG